MLKKEIYKTSKGILPKSLQARAVLDLLLRNDVEWLDKEDLDEFLMAIKSEKGGLEVVEDFAIEKLFSEQNEEKFCRVSFLDEEIIIKNDSLIELLEEIIERFTNK